MLSEESVRRACTRSQGSPAICPATWCHRTLDGEGGEAGLLVHPCRCPPCLRGSSKPAPSVAALCVGRVQVVTVDRSSSSSRRDAAGEIKRRAMCNDWPHVALFPEATTTNGRSLVSFKTGAFVPGLPVQPVVVRYPYTTFDPSWVADGMPTLTLIFRMMCCLNNQMIVSALLPAIPIILLGPPSPPCTEVPPVPVADGLEGSGIAPWHSVGYTNPVVCLLGAGGVPAPYLSNARGGEGCAPLCRAVPSGEASLDPSRSQETSPGVRPPGYTPVCARKPWRWSFVELPDGDTGSHLGAARRALPPCARCVQAMAKALNVNTTEHAFGDVALALEAQKLKLPPGTTNLEYGRFEHLYHLDLQEAKAFLRRFNQLDVHRRYCRGTWKLCAVYCLERRHSVGAPWALLPFVS